MTPTRFRGWSKAAIDFYRELEVENSKTFWTAHKTPYKTRCYAVTEGEGGEAFYVEISADGLVTATG